jgi:hypothetical protein
MALIVGVVSPEDLQRIKDSGYDLWEGELPYPLGDKLGLIDSEVVVGVWVDADPTDLLHLHTDPPPFWYSGKGRPDA